MESAGTLRSQALHTLHNEESDSASLSGGEPSHKRQRRLSNSHNGKVDLVHGRRMRHLAHVRIPSPALTPSAFLGWASPSPDSAEHSAIHDLLSTSGVSCYDAEGSSYNSICLDDFTIYCTPQTRRANEMVSLDKLLSDGYPTFLFDGVLSVRGTRHFVRAVPFRTLVIDGYLDTDDVGVDKKIFIQSLTGGYKKTWYQLGRPSAAYKRFYQPFLWLAQFTKHFLHYLAEHELVTIQDFFRWFYEWLEARYLQADAHRCHSPVQQKAAIVLDQHSTVTVSSQHDTYTDLDQQKITSDPSQCESSGILGQREIVAAWLSEASSSDFRTAVVANVGFLYKECCGIDDEENRLGDRPIWDEVDFRCLEAIPRQPAIEQQTIVTPFAYDCFKNLYFGDQLEVRNVQAPFLRAAVTSRKQRMGLTPFTEYRSATIAGEIRNLEGSSHFGASAASLEHQVEAGCVVSVNPGGIGWEKSSSTVWFAYVQNVREFKSGRVSLDVIWLYHPCDTTIGNAYYPFDNELFMSDNCNCGKDALDLEHVLANVHVSWFARNPSAENGLFVRRKFRTIEEDDTYDFIELTAADFVCGCRKDSSQDSGGPQNDFFVGSTVLYSGKKQHLQVAQVIGVQNSHTMQLRRLLRKDTIDLSAPPNELLLTDEQIKIARRDCIRRCHVRIFDSDLASVPPPYNRNGAGDFYYVRGSPFTETQGYGIANTFPPIIQGWNPYGPNPHRILRGMGIFCGGGTFDRGLEEGGAVKFRYAVDYAAPALHSYKANAFHKIHYFLGSVDDYLAQAFAARADDTIAMPGDFDILAGGSPCQGFSMLQNCKGSTQSRRNASRIASVVSYVDFYSPTYLVLENVVALTSNMGPKKDQNVFSQLIAALVALGYQVQQFLMDAWSYGSSQRRSRVFIIACAPGTKPLTHPPISHSHPPLPGGHSTSFRSRALGVSANGKRFGVRRNAETPFPYVSAAAAVQDLPDIYEGLVRLNPKFPDHRTAMAESSRSRDRIAMVPVRPFGMGLMQAHYQGLTYGHPRQWCQDANEIRRKADSKLYRRIDPRGLFPTIVTKFCVEDGLNGRVLHWDQHRVISIMEARRAQGFPDHEVIVGSPAQQLEIIGNSVERNTAMVLGLQIRESWCSSQPYLENEADDS